MPIFNTVTFPLISILTVFSFAGRSHADQVSDLKLNIRNAAQVIISTIDNSSASSTALEEALARILDAQNRIGSSGGSAQVICAPSANSAYATLTRVSDGLAFGSPTYASTCQSFIQASTNGIICGSALNTSYAYMFSIASGTRLGEGTSVARCNALVQTARHNLVCSSAVNESYAFLTRTSDGAILGAGVVSSTCTDILAHATETLFCKPFPNPVYAAVTRISDGVELGQAVSLGACYQALGQ